MQSGVLRDSHSHSEPSIDAKDGLADDQHEEGKEDVAEQPTAPQKKISKKAAKAAKTQHKPGAKKSVGKVTRAMAHQKQQQDQQHQNAQALPEDDDIPDAGALPDGSDADASQMSVDSQEGDDDIKVEDFEREEMQRAASQSEPALVTKRKLSGGKESISAANKAKAAVKHGALCLDIMPQSFLN